MKIAYLTCVYPPYPGGIGYQAQGMAQEMIKRGHEVHVYTPHYNGVKSEIRNSKFETNSNYQNPKVHYVRPLFRYGNAAFLPQLLWQLKDFDIIHLCYPFFGVAELLLLIKRASRAKIVVHHLMDAVAPGWLGGIFKLHTRYCMPRIFKAADKVLVLSEDYWHNSELEKLQLKNVDIVPNAVDTDLFQPERGANYESVANSRISNSKIRKFESHSQLEPPTILFVGGLDRAHHFKGVDVLIRACEILKAKDVQFQCKIIGEGNLRQEYERRADGLAEFVGLVPHDQLPAYYQKAAVVVVPATSRVECFSIVAAEAQACGTPAIVSDFPGARVTIEDGITGYVVKPNDSAALADRIHELVTRREQAEIMGRSGRARVEKLYSWNIIGDRLDFIYENCRHS